MENHRTFDAIITNNSTREQLDGGLHVSSETVAFETDLRIFLEVPIERVFAWKNDFGYYVSALQGETIWTAQIDAEAFDILRVITA